jgi:hypothetical protein
MDEADKAKLDKVVALLNNLVTKKFYGELLIKFESGHIVIYKLTETIKVS